MTAFSQPRTAAWIVLLPDSPGSLVVPNGDDASDLHCTLWFLGSASESPVKPSDAASALSALSAVTRPVEARVASAMKLGNDSPQAMVLTLVGPRLAVIRDEIRARVPAIPPPLYSRFRPHVTVGYDVPAPNMSGRLIRFSRIALWWGSNRAEFHLRG